MTPTQHEINDWLDYMVETRSHEITNKLPHIELLSIAELSIIGGFSSIRSRKIPKPVLDFIKKGADELIAIGNECKGYFGVSLTDYSKEELIMIIHLFYAENRYTEHLYYKALKEQFKS